MAWTSAAVSTIYNKDQGTFVVEAETPYYAGGNFTLVGGTTQGFNLRVDSSKVRSAIRGVADLITSTGPEITYAPYRVAGSYKSGANAISANGGTAVTSSVSFTTTAPTEIGIGYDALSVTNYANGWIRKLYYYNTALATAQLETLSAL